MFWIRIMYDLMSVKENPLLLFRGFDFAFESATFKTRFWGKNNGSVEFYV